MNQEALNYWRYLRVHHIIYTYCIFTYIPQKKGVLSLQIKQGEHHFPSKNVFTNWVFQWVGLVFTFSRDTSCSYIHSTSFFLRSHFWSRYSRKEGKKKKKLWKLFYLYFQFWFFSYIALLFFKGSPSKWQTTLPLYKV